MPTWAIVFAVVLLLGLIAGLLLRFFVTMACLIAGGVGLAYLLGYVSMSQISEGFTELQRILSAAGVSSTLLFTGTGLVFVAGMCGGVLLTSRLRAFDHVSAS